MSEMKKIYAQMSAVMNDIDPIKKDRDANINDRQKYKFRGIDDIYNACQRVMAKHKVFCVPIVLDFKREERETKSGGALFYTILKVKYKFFAEDGSFVTSIVYGEAMDTSDKSTNKALSAALKYVFLQIFMIPTEEEKDTEANHLEAKPKKTAQELKLEFNAKLEAMLGGFSLLGITKAALEVERGRKFEEFTEDDLKELRGFYQRAKATYEEAKAALEGIKKEEKKEYTVLMGKFIGKKLSDISKSELEYELMRLERATPSEKTNELVSEIKKHLKGNVNE